MRMYLFAAWRKNWMACQLPIIRLEVITFSHFYARFMVLKCANRATPSDAVDEASERAKEMAGFEMAEIDLCLWAPRAIIALKFWLIATNSTKHRKSPNLWKEWTDERTGDRFDFKSMPSLCVTWMQLNHWNKIQRLWKCTGSNVLCALESDANESIVVCLALSFRCISFQNG